MPNTTDKDPISKTDTPTPVSNRPAYTVENACRLLGDIGRTTLYGLIAEGKLEGLKLGSRTLITGTSIDSLLASLPRLSGNVVDLRKVEADE